MLSKLLHAIREYFRPKTNEQPSVPPPPVAVEDLQGRGFEFLLVPADLEIAKEDFDAVMTPDSFPWSKVQKGGWDYYQVGEDEFSYSWEEPGIQMCFNPTIPYPKAQAIAAEVVQKLSRYCGQDVELMLIPKDKIISF